ncbi:low molecular weight protein arginine phosphatase [Halobacillus salinarum]|uniref:Low molecular weight protein arginine phosphatase n=1 Tax=Halobacillus salinarum TaxID=2932257 RepID=A0ABY4ELT9_9BACI|nr:low molecular weight protein arginine phosphatase [Halobacillus salinarum]UOQ45345.1 low molecular weight protein arginine phosphatase [Halobacillus salinarum]
MNILFICTGNTCRSPMAEALLKAKNDEFNVKSAGIFAGDGQPLSKNSAAVLKEMDLTCDHSSVALNEELLQWADLVFTMTDRHKEALAMQYPHYEDKVFTLKEFVLIKDEDWKQLKFLYSNLEEKRLAILTNTPEDVSDEELEEKLQEELKEDIQAIQKLEEQMPNMNILDPYGMDIEVYRRTRDELNELLDLLIKKLEADLKG